MPAQMTRPTSHSPASTLARRPHRHQAVAVAAVLALSASGCSTVENALSGDRVDYRSTAVRASPLDVPPDLTQLARDSRYAPQTGASISAASQPSQPGTAAPSASVATQPVTQAGASATAATSAGGVRIERAGNQRWLVVGQTPEQLWPRVLAFWKERGFTLATEQADIGIVETDWAENRAKLPQDFIRAAIGRALSNLYSTGERDRFRTRIERTPAGSEIFISHRGMIEVYADAQKNSTIWQPRPAEPELEAEFLLRMSAALTGAPSRPTQTAAVATSTATIATPASTTPARARLVQGQASAALQVDDPFERAWRRVGLALDRSGFTVEDRDRGSGLYFVRYVPQAAGPTEQPGVFSRLFSSKPDANSAQRLRIQVKGDTDARSTVNVLSADGAADKSDSAQRIVALLLEDLK